MSKETPKHLSETRINSGLNGRPRKLVYDADGELIVKDELSPEEIVAMGDSIKHYSLDERPERLLYRELSSTVPNVRGDSAGVADVD